jgi:1,2-phenylacetyl-CoA epoxidase PaaB subunit
MDKPRIYRVPSQDGGDVWVCRTDDVRASDKTPRKAYEKWSERYWRENFKDRERVSGHKRQFAILDAIAAIYRRIGADGRKNG